MNRAMLFLHYVRKQAASPKFRKTKLMALGLGISTRISFDFSKENVDLILRKNTLQNSILFSAKLPPTKPEKEKKQDTKEEENISGLGAWDPSIWISRVYGSSRQVIIPRKAITKKLCTGRYKSCFSCNCSRFMEQSEILLSDRAMFVFHNIARHMADRRAGRCLYFKKEMVDYFGI